MVIKKKTTSVKKGVAGVKKAVAIKKVASVKKRVSVKKPAVKKVVAKKVPTKKVEVIVEMPSTNVKRKSNSCVYSHADVDRLLDSTPKFSKFYHLMTCLVYAGIMVIIWMFVYYAYTIDKPIYDLLCVNCGKATINIVKVIITTWLFALYFYFLCELRCRAWDLCIFTTDSLVKKTNKWILAMSVLFTGLTSMFFWF
jgi:hypothetical protein